jgi:hypothetical protein
VLDLVLLDMYKDMDERISELLGKTQVQSVVMHKGLMQQ